MKKIKKNVWIIGSVTVIVLLLLSCFAVNIAQTSINKIFLPDNAVIGVDVSNHQGDIDMDKLWEQNVKFIYIKATEGSSYIDAYFNVNREKVRKSKLKFGAYHFFSFDSDGETQAVNYINTVGDLSGALIPAVDVEYYGDKKSNPPEKDMVLRELKKCLEVLENRYQVKPMIYTTQSVYLKYLRGFADDYPLWARSVYYPIKFGNWNDWHIWQYSDHGLLNGYNGDEKYIDMNVLNSDTELNSLIVR